MAKQPAVIITGAGRGIGRATAVALASRGYRLGLVSRSRDELAETAKLCGDGAVAIPADITDLASVEAVVERALKEFGQLDALVHNAGLAVMKPIDQISPAEWHAMLDTNLSAAFYFCRLLWPLWRKQGGGTLVLVSSEAARNPFPGLAAYAAAKAGLNSLTLSLAREGAPFGVRVHCVAPGGVETKMLRDLASKEQYPPERTLDPADVAAVIAQCVHGDLRHAGGEVIYVHKSA